jgi:MFS family permease
MAGWFGRRALAWVPVQSWRPHLLAGLVLVLYALFSASNGLNQLTVASLQGKLISPGHRGRAMVVSVVVGSVVAILAAILFLGPWLAESDGFPKIFGMTAVFFGVAAAIPILFDEPADPLHPTRHPGAAGEGGNRQSAPPVRQATWRATLQADRSLVRLCLVAGCFSAVLMLFPHYQAFARDRLGSQVGSLLTWVVAQNAATGVASLVAGPVADRSGTRIVLIWLVALSSLTPSIVILLSMLAPGTAVDLFWLVYLPLGLNPISLKIFTNYALELAPRPAEHPRYVSIVGAALAAPFILSPLVGMAVDGIGFTPVFVAGAAVIMVGAAVATGLPEPRSDSTGSHRARGLPHKAARREPAG